MEAKIATALSVLALLEASSIFHSPVEAFPSNQELKQHPIASSSNGVDCSSFEDGEKISSPNSCSNFYECDHGVAYLFQCANMTDGGQLYFDPKLQSCNWPSEVDCKIRSTEPTMVTESFNPSTKTQNDELLRKFTAFVDPTIDIDCLEADYGERAPSPTNCSEYFVCYWHHANMPTCKNCKCPMMRSGESLKYDPELRVCNWPWLVNCENTTT